MQRLVLALAATAAFSMPAAAQSLSVLLPQITFPEPVTSPSTKGCDTPAPGICQLAE